MAESVTIARPYAEALFRVAKESGNLAKWSESVTKLGQLAANPEARSAISDPMLLQPNWLTCFGLPAVRR
jgi:F-type H+-transporting ATPase subunit delta